MRFLLILAQISKIFLGALPPNPLIYTSFLLKFKTLLIYPTINFQHTMRFLLILAQISQNFLGGSAPKPPNIYFLPVKIQDTPHLSYYQHTMRFLLILAQISKIFLGALPPNPLIYTSFQLKFKTLLIYPTINFQHTMRFLLVLA